MSTPKVSKANISPDQAVERMVQALRRAHQMPRKQQKDMKLGKPWAKRNGSEHKATQTEAKADKP
jgi:hypothetical protein